VHTRVPLGLPTCISTDRVATALQLNLVLPSLVPSPTVTGFGVAVNVARELVIKTGPGFRATPDDVSFEAHVVHPAKHEC
jgi:hypothetical protein